MVRTRRLTDAALADLGASALFVVVLVCLAVAVIAVGVICAFEWLQKRRWLGPLCAGLLLAAIALAITGCATTPAPAPTTREPEIYRPVNPRYPLPR